MYPPSFKLWRRRTVTERITADLEQQFFRCAYAICHDANAAQVITQKTKASVLKKHMELHDLQQIETYSFKILINFCRDHFEQGGIAWPLKHDDCHAGTAPERLPLEQQQLIVIRQALAALPLDQRCVVALVELGSQSYEKVSCILEVPIDIVTNSMVQARRALLATISSAQHRALFTACR